MRYKTIDKVDRLEHRLKRLEIWSKQLPPNAQEDMISEVQELALLGTAEMFNLHPADMIEEVFLDYFGEECEEAEWADPTEVVFHDGLSYADAVVVIKYWNNKFRDHLPDPLSRMPKSDPELAQRIASDKIANFERYTGKLLLIKKELKDCYDRMIKVLESIE